MARQWKQFPLDIPIDGTLIWVRIDIWTGAPFAAKFNLTLMTVTSLINNISYDVRTIGSWRLADPPINLPDYPISGIDGPNGNSQIQLFVGTSTTWRLTFSMSAPPQNGFEYAVIFQGTYADPALGDPPLSAYSTMYKFNLQPFVIGVRYGIIGFSSSSQLRLFAGVLVNSDTKVLQAGFRMFIRYAIIHIPTGYQFPFVVESVQVT